MGGAGQRLDRWLFFARVVKSRTLAARLVEDGFVRVNGVRALAASRSVGVGDVLTVALERNLRILRVRAIGERRGPFREAQSLFEDLGEPLAGAIAADAGPLATSDISE